MRVRGIKGDAVNQAFKKPHPLAAMSLFGTLAGLSAPTRSVSADPATSLGAAGKSGNSGVTVYAETSLATDDSFIGCTQWPGCPPPPPGC